MDDKIRQPIIVGKIDLDSLNQSTRRPPDPAQPFKIRILTVGFGKQEPVTIDFGELDDRNVDDRYFSLLIGRNGLGKSMLLCEIIEFMVDASKNEMTRASRPVSIKAIGYELGGHTYYMECDDTGRFSYQIDNKRASCSRMEFPLIIASSMGMFDKFPLSTKSWRKGRYAVDFYRYVGPKASSNMYSTKTSLMSQMLSNLSDLKHRRQMTSIGNVLQFIDYGSKLTIKYKIKGTGEKASYKKPLGRSAQKYIEKMPTNETITESIDFEKDTMPHVKSLKMRELGELRQKGYLSQYDCFLQKDGQLVECNDMSSGEFNMLSMVMSIVLTSTSSHILVLLDEPEISQHPNWQMEIIDNLDETLKDYKCHFLIATHCHFLVSNLPQGRSNVIDIEKNEEGRIEVMPLLSDTYGWSAEEVLLKAFKMSTDRNKYLAEVVGKLMKDIGNNSINEAEVVQQTDFLRMVAGNLSDVDPMKKIISTILEGFGK